MVAFSGRVGGAGRIAALVLQPIVSSLEPLALFLGALRRTAVTDNTALTYLGSVISWTPEESKYTLVAEAVAGGGLTDRQCAKSHGSCAAEARLRQRVRRC